MHWHKSVLFISLIFFLSSTNGYAQRKKQHKEVYRKGVELLEQNRAMEALPYLINSAPRQGQNGWWHLTRAYMLTYRFDDAAQAYERYKDAFKHSERIPEQSSRMELRIKAAQSMIKNVELITVIDSITVSKNQFIDLLKLTEGGGSFNNSGFSVTDSLPLSSFTNGMHSYRLLTLQDSLSITGIMEQSRIGNRWSNPKRIESISSGKNENFAFLRQDGISLIFARENGTDGIGGYDLYMARRELDSDNYLPPTILGMPFNSPYNDYVLAYDEEKGIGYLVSDRFCAPGLVCLYTFIPNEKFKPIETDDPMEIIRQASWHSVIRKQSENLSEESTNESSTTLNSSPQYDFTFPLGNGLIYHQWSDFNEPSAQHLYRQSLELNTAITSLKENLQQLRKQYGQSTQEEKAGLKPEILNKEKQLEENLSAYNKLIKQVRNIELGNRN